MLPNVWEWEKHCYCNYQDETLADPHGPEEGASRVVRGGGWSDDARNCRAAIRYYFAPADCVSYLGFRLARSVALGP